jgi:hypothetical protein
VSCRLCRRAAPNRTIRSHVEIADGDGCRLAGAGAGVVEEQQDAVIATALLSCAVWRGQERVDLGLVEIAETRPVIAFERDGADLAAPGNQLRAALADERRERMDRCQSLVARPDAAAAALLDVAEEAAHDIRRHLRHDQAIDGRLVVIGRKRDQESKRVTVTPLRIAGEVTLNDEMLEEEPTDPAARCTPSCVFM